MRCRCGIPGRVGIFASLWIRFSPIKSFLRGPPHDGGYLSRIVWLIVQPFAANGSTSCFFLTSCLGTDRRPAMTLKIPIICENTTCADTVACVFMRHGSRPSICLSKLKGRSVTFLKSMTCPASGIQAGIGPNKPVSIGMMRSFGHIRAK